MATVSPVPMFIRSSDPSRPEVAFRPATISFIIVKAYEMSQVDLVINITLTFIAIGALFTLFASMVPRINAKIVNILSKIFGLFLTAIGIEMMVAGIRAIMLLH